MFVGKRAREDESTERAVDPPPRSRTFFNMSTSVPLDGDPVEMTAKVDLGLHLVESTKAAYIAKLAVPMSQTPIILAAEAEKMAVAVAGPPMVNAQWDSVSGTPDGEGARDISLDLEAEYAREEVTLSNAGSMEVKDTKWVHLPAKDIYSVGALVQETNLAILKSAVHRGRATNRVSYLHSEGVPNGYKGFHPPKRVYPLGHGPDQPTLPTDLLEVSVAPMPFVQYKVHAAAMHLLQRPVYGKAPVTPNIGDTWKTAPHNHMVTNQIAIQLPDGEGPQTIQGLQALVNGVQGLQMKIPKVYRYSVIGGHRAGGGLGQFSTQDYGMQQPTSYSTVQYIPSKNGHWDNSWAAPSVYHDGAVGTAVVPLTDVTEDPGIYHAGDSRQDGGHSGFGIRRPYTTPSGNFKYGNSSSTAGYQNDWMIPDEMVITLVEDSSAYLNNWKDSKGAAILNSTSGEAAAFRAYGNKDFAVLTVKGMIFSKSLDGYIGKRLIPTDYRFQDRPWNSDDRLARSPDLITGCYFSKGQGEGDPVSYRPIMQAYDHDVVICASSFVVPTADTQVTQDGITNTYPGLEASDWNYYLSKFPNTTIPLGMYPADANDQFACGPLVMPKNGFARGNYTCSALLAIGQGGPTGGVASTILRPTQWQTSGVDKPLSAFGALVYLHGHLLSDVQYQFYAGSECTYNGQTYTVVSMTAASAQPFLLNQADEFSRWYNYQGADVDNYGILMLEQPIERDGADRGEFYNEQYVTEPGNDKVRFKATKVEGYKQNCSDPIANNVSCLNVQVTTKNDVPVKWMLVTRVLTNCTDYVFPDDIIQDDSVRDNGKSLVQRSDDFSSKYFEEQGVEFVNKAVVNKDGGELVEAKSHLQYFDLGRTQGKCTVTYSSASSNPNVVHADSSTTHMRPMQQLMGIAGQINQCWVVGVAAGVTGNLESDASLFDNGRTYVGRTGYIIPAKFSVEAILPPMGATYDGTSHTHPLKAQPLISSMGTGTEMQNALVPPLWMGRKFAGSQMPADIPNIQGVVDGGGAMELVAGPGFTQSSTLLFNKVLSTRYGITTHDYVVPMSGAMQTLATSVENITSDNYAVYVSATEGWQNPYQSAKMRTLDSANPMAASKDDGTDLVHTPLVASGDLMSDIVDLQIETTNRGVSGEISASGAPVPVMMSLQPAHFDGFKADTINYQVYNFNGIPSRVYSMGGLGSGALELAINVMYRDGTIKRLKIPPGGRLNIMFVAMNSFE
tara:strand:+ start:1922 stop:5626 length:3705 start_codon:yes stop_codon:yes gene_type:complete